MKKLKLSKKRKAWVGRREDVMLKGDRLTYNAAQQSRYKQSILDLVESMIESVEMAVKKFFKSSVAKQFYATDDNKKDKTPKQIAATAAASSTISAGAKKLTDALTKKFNQLFDRSAKEIAQELAFESLKSSETRLKTSFKTLSGGVTLNTDILTGPLKQVVSAAVAENVSLIKSIASEYLSDVEGSVMRSITTGGGLQELIPALEKHGGITKRRARNIAEDQTRKIYNQINKSRMQAVGIKKFMWLHSAGGQKPRRSHIALSNNVFSFDDLPVINQEQVDAGYEGPIRGIPGQAINCRCTMTPVIEFDNGEQDASEEG